ncbi:hypothetical protein [Foetidibacter luteolus]|uniref:hypothetical protein n=1 Tax=Foetidibacter luteolus TaxID=2608880 RepID=UPI00129AE811|nr:hypothetical protein [Foetidibacter luteolus]
MTKDTNMPPGKCDLCGEEFSKTALQRHLAGHLSKKIPGGKAGESFYIRITPDIGKNTLSPYFLYIWADGDTSFEELDYFLRDIWLECCEHLSGFNKKVSQQKKQANRINFNLNMTRAELEKFWEEDELNGGEIAKDRLLKGFMKKGDEFNYCYDYGSSTDLLLTILDKLPIAADDFIMLLSRNEPPPLMCSDCRKKPAVKICTACQWDEEALFCSTCAKKHAKKCREAEWSLYSAANSPRMGVCGYEGGLIDVARDQPYKLPKKKSGTANSKEATTGAAG